jgi:DNA-binding HxlR family transcriptional regulator
MSGEGERERCSGCPLSVSLDVFGDRWSLLIVRDLMVRGFRTFREFRNSGEGIATNVLADRLKRLEANGVIVAEGDPHDARRVNYRLTEKGIDLAPALLEIFVWAAKYEHTGASTEIVDAMERRRDWVLAEARRRWRERDLTPLIPRPAGPDGGKLKISADVVKTR